MQPFEDLEIWRRSRALSLEVYTLSKDFPAFEQFAFTSQLRRAAVSVPTNIAEGTQRLHATDFARFLNMSEGSLGEVRSLLLMALDLDYGHVPAIQAALAESREISRMLCRFRQRVEMRGAARRGTAAKQRGPH